MSGAHTSNDKLPGLHLGSTACSLTNSIILSPAPCSRSPWSQQFHWFLGRSFLRSLGLRSRAIVWSRAIAASLGIAVRRPHGPMDVAGSCRRKDEKPKDIHSNGGKGCFGFSHDQARGVPALRATRSSLALLWQNVFWPLFFKDLLSAIWALLRRRPKDEIDDGMAYGGHGWLRRRPVDSFFSAPRMRGDDVAGRRRQSLS